MGASRWLIYLKERFPIVVYAILVAGICLSGAFLSGAEFNSLPFIFSFLGILLFFALLRLMDELKDFEKDKIAHSERPLPRGLLSVPEVSRTINNGAIGLILYSLLVGFLFNPIAGATYLILIVHLWLMYREFYVPHWLEARPLVYAISHQAVLLWVCTFGIFIFSPVKASEATPYLYSLLVLGSFFTYEVCRKLDPNASPVLRTYRYVYGVWGSFAIVVVAMLLSAVASYFLGYCGLEWPVAAIVLLSYVFLANKHHKAVEAITSLSLILHIWIVVLYLLKGRFL